MFCGIMTGIEMTVESVEIQPGDTLVLYTDGVTEAFDARETLFGEARLLECLRGSAGRPAAESVSAVLNAVHQHAANCAQSDDISVVALRRAS
jgi:sigma-B regulation protein RsbU (phosphoserine phosphatase)